MDLRTSPLAAGRCAIGAGLAVAAGLALAQCRSQPRPLEAAEACACGVREYCHVIPASRGGAQATRVECVAMPPSCLAHPSCDCLGAPSEACREEVGRFTVFTPRAVEGCAECSREELCSIRAGGSRACALLPARCADEPTCDCFLRGRAAARASCREDGGRLEVVAASAP